ncbi:3-deoxy-D-manno-octulosonic acid kinase [Rodentibacter caecimuris]|uniref:3-deoxy-D-manno-octulosonic acid kinase n=1 Tax=Rodentibacter caecimuris TaxID=1796644 RepID=A0ABX3L2M7_9PAST|nr:3-deoxy-D-manno-octulosonic acid kinase [Rodentibacter heylii]
MQQLQQNNCFFIFNSTQSFPNINDFFTLQFWQNQNRVIGSAKGRGTTYFLKTKDLFGVNTALRHYYRGGIWGKINRDCYQFNTLETTRSFAEFHLLQNLHQQGFPVPKPIGAKISKTILGRYRADILTEQIENAEDLTAFLQRTSLSEPYWREIGRLVRRLHNLQICHTDLNAHNILLQQTEQGSKFWLIDFDKCGQKSGSFWKEQNLQRLKRSFLKEKKRMAIYFEKDNWQNVLAGYHE